MFQFTAHHGNLYILIPLNQRLALTMPRATGPWPIADRHVPIKDLGNKCGLHFGSSSIHVSKVASVVTFFTSNMSNIVEECHNEIAGVTVALLLTANSKRSSKIMSQFFAVRLLYIHSA